LNFALTFPCFAEFATDCSGLSTRSTLYPERGIKPKAVAVFATNYRLFYVFKRKWPNLKPEGKAFCTSRTTNYKPTMPDYQSQEFLFQRIKELLPPHASLVDTVANILHVSSDSAYSVFAGNPYGVG
jgi:hypothetical protein